MSAPRLRWRGALRPDVRRCPGAAARGGPGARGPPSHPGSAQHTRVSPHTPHGLLARRPERSRAGPAHTRVPGRGSHAAALTATRPTRGAAGLCTRLTAGPAARRPEVRPGTYTCRPPRRRRQHTRARQQPRARPGPRSAASLRARPYSPRSSAPSMPNTDTWGPVPPPGPSQGSRRGVAMAPALLLTGTQEGELHLWGARDPSHGSRAPGSPAAASTS